MDVRGQQDNELFHLLILEELIAASGCRESRFRHLWLPQAIAFGYYHWSWMLYVVRPAVITGDSPRQPTFSRQIGHYKRFHKQEGIDMIQTARFR